MCFPMWVFWECEWFSQHEVHNRAVFAISIAFVASADDGRRTCVKKAKWHKKFGQTQTCICNFINKSWYCWRFQRMSDELAFFLKDRGQKVKMRDFCWAYNFNSFSYFGGRGEHQITDISLKTLLCFHGVAWKHQPIVHWHFLSRTLSLFPETWKFMETASRQLHRVTGSFQKFHFCFEFLQLLWFHGLFNAAMVDTTLVFVVLFWKKLKSKWTKTLFSFCAHSIKILLGGIWVAHFSCSAFPQMKKFCFPVCKSSQLSH